MVLTRSKRKVVQDDKDNDVQIVIPSAPKRKTTSNKVIKKIKTKEKEGEIEKEKKHWKDANVEVMIALRGEMEPKFLKKMQKKCMLKFFVVQFFLKKTKKNPDFRLGELGLLKALALASSPPFSHEGGQWW